MKQFVDREPELGALEREYAKEGGIACHCVRQEGDVLLK